MTMNNSSIHAERIKLRVLNEQLKPRKPVTAKPVAGKPSILFFNLLKKAK